MKKLAVGELLSPLVEVDTLRSVFRRRKDENEYRKIPTEDQKKYLGDGWQVHKEMASHLWVKRPKSAEIMLEDRIWCLFYRMGYTQISGANFRIELKKSDGSAGSKRINVLAADDETVVVVECREESIAVVGLFKRTLMI